MKKSISKSIFMYMMLFSLLIMGIIGVSTKFVLPTYYYNRQIEYFEEMQKSIQNAYNAQDPKAVIGYMEDLQQNLGGQLYVDDGQNSMGTGYGQKKHMMNHQGEQFKPSGDVTMYSYSNKLGMEIRVIGVLLGGEYLVYEGNIQTINRATTTIFNFIMMVLMGSMVVALLISWGLSKRIAKPIQDLNHLAEKMKSKEVQPTIVHHKADEIGQLNQTLNELYEELISSIYQLQSELLKERNAEQLKKRFLAQATHELKTPLAIIQGYAEMLDDGLFQSTQERNRLIKSIYSESEGLSRLLSDVLDYTKMETGNYILNTAKINGQALLDQLKPRIESYVHSNHLALQWEAEDLDREFLLDKERVIQVIWNLVSNGVDHGKSKVVVQSSPVGERLRIRVYNDGPLINPQDLPYVFDSFYKKDGKKEGYGLGLAIVKQIVLLHQGEFFVKNTQDGVEFVIIL